MSIVNLEDKKRETIEDKLSDLPGQLVTITLRTGGFVRGRIADVIKGFVVFKDRATKSVDVRDIDDVKLEKVSK